jgi:DNA-binding response OmpR family regulator
MTAPATLILAEPDGETLQMLDTYFRAQGYRTVHVFSCEAVEEPAVSLPADMIILDSCLPGEGALELAKRLHANRRTAGIPILMLSDPMERGMRLDMLAAGVEDTAARPFDLQELGLRVRNALERASRSRTMNPITDLPEGRPVDEALQRMLVQPAWSLLDIRAIHLDAFRAARGFPVANEMLRAVGKTLQQAAAERLKVGVLVGHRAIDEFIILSDLPSLDEFVKMAATWLAETTQSFRPVYSSLDPQHPTPDIRFQFRMLSSSDGPFDTRDALLVALDQTPPRTL